MAWWIWVLIGFVLLAVEMASTTMHIAFFAVGAFVVAVLVAVGVHLPLWGELLVFTGVSLAAFFFVRPYVVRRLRLNETRVVDTLVGEQAIALDDIAPASIGKAEMRGTTWSARNIGETSLARGQRCVVTHVEGLVLHVRVA
ncbi:MAG: NfeD family protein [Acidobacteria bacterium]|nr:NfeD family protein [Acidobacteriota bacterium]MBV9474979.1 NfeD family protein [Acidobacteriota bacterium]